MVENTFLFDGYQTFFEKLIPKNEEPFPLVLAHNDSHEKNILMSLKDNK